MIIYKGLKSQFQEIRYKMDFAEKIRKTTGKEYNQGSPEWEAWLDSYDPISKALSTPSIPDDVSVVLEYTLKVGNFRIDYLLTGKDSNGRPNAVIIELKQWSAKNIEASAKYENLIHVKQYGPQQACVHPSYQAWSYATMLSNYNANVQDQNISIHPCAYLYNYHPMGNDILRGSEFSEILSQAELFDAGQGSKLQQYLADILVCGDNFEVYDTIDGSEIKPSAALQGKVKDMLEGNPAFTLVDSQKEVFEKAKAYIFDSMSDGKRRTYIIHGGPGTGKSVVAINLMADLLIQGIPNKRFRPGVKTNDLLKKSGRGFTALYCPYVTKTQAPREVYMALLNSFSASGKKWKKKDLLGLFLGAGKFNEIPKTPLYAGLIVDEAHRLKGIDRFSKNATYLESIMLNAYTTVFFIDDRQRISTEDFGSSETIRRYAEKNGIEVFEDELKTEFRCLGSNEYISWLDSLLYDDLGKIQPLRTAEFSFRVFDDLNAMHDAILQKDRESTSELGSRVCAGYCWEWKSKNNPAAFDVVISKPNHDTYQKQWNLSNSSVPYAIDKSQEQIGCIHTVQGLEFEYIGVIIGEDLRFENGTLITDITKRASSDQTRLDRKMQDRASFREIILNTYRVLMTRGQKGCYVYCVDEQLSRFLSAFNTI